MIVVLLTPRNFKGSQFSIFEQNYVSADGRQPSRPTQRRFLVKAFLLFRDSAILFSGFITQFSGASQAQVNGVFPLDLAFAVATPLLC
ncbi:hypothetical protein AGR8A_pAt30005 [Agrobacterium fabrum str. J-07]|nr:hypothetical protein AGR8A_pAt30005 [Agrobacterium fabrum str. J-07]